MKNQMLLLTFVALATVAMVCAKEKYLAERPTFISPCNLTDPNLIRCFTKNFKVIFKEWKDGVPGLKNLGALDPLLIKRIGITQEDNNPLVQMNVDMLNVKITGLSDFEPKDISYDFNNLTMEGKGSAEKLVLQADYKVKGRLLNLPLDSSGKVTLKVDDFSIKMDGHVNLRDDFGYTFLDVDKMQFAIKEVGGFHIDLENLFNGQKELEESTNIIINDNWREFYAIMGPTITETIHGILFDRMKKIFAFVPASYFINDLPTAATFYGQRN